MRHAPIDGAIRRFIAHDLQTVPGWLLDTAAHMTSYLMDVQRQRGVRGGAFEIGVYAGKYLSLIYRLTATREPVTGVDVFDRITADEVEAHFRRLFGRPDRLRLITSDSRDLDAARLVEEMRGQRPRFISVDGDHNADTVAQDLELAVAILGDDGLVAVDDYLNPIAIGVHEGVCRYFAGANAGRLAPFCYCANKLFLCRSAQQSFWREVAYGLAAVEPDLAGSRDFRQRQAQGESYVQQTLQGVPVVIH